MKYGLSVKKCQISFILQTYLKRFELVLFISQTVLVDKNECLKDVCPKNSVCYNTLGSFLCKCIPGYWKSLGRCKSK